MKLIESGILQKFTAKVFIHYGFNEIQAHDAASVLITADLRGIDSHGVARLAGYVRQIEQGKIKPDAVFTIEHETLSTATLNAGGGLGLLSAPHAMKIAVEKAKKCGSGFVAVNNSSHFGIAAAHSKIALEHEMIGIALTNASPLVAPAGSVQPMLGTNPICVGIPGRKTPFVLDMATTVVANGKLEIAERKGEKIPHGYVQKSNGSPSDNPSELKNGGTLLPLGGSMDHASYKGYGLGSLVDILSGVLSGANFGPWVPPFVGFLDTKQEMVGQGIGHFLGAIRIDAFRTKDDFYNSMDQWMKAMKAAKTDPQTEKVLIPGEPEDETHSKRVKQGIPLNEKVLEKLNELAAKTNQNSL